jgi:hypothetical protein
VRRAPQYRLASFEPMLPRQVHPVRTLPVGANLRFKDAELAQRNSRIFRRTRMAWS